MHFPDHPSATIGLSNILLDIYNETLLPPPAIPGLNVATSGSVTGSLLAAHGSTLSTTESLSARRAGEPYLSGSDSALPSGPLGLGFGGPPSSQQQQQQQNQHHARRQPLAAHSRGATSLGGGPSHASTVLPSTPFSSSILAELQRESNPADSGGPGSASSGDETHVLPPPYKARSLPLVDRIAARDRAFTLLSGLTRLGSGWNSADAWFALARAHEECGQNDRARDLLWWCVELEEGTGVRDWSCVGGGVGYVL